VKGACAHLLSASRTIRRCAPIDHLPAAKSIRIKQLPRIARW